MKSLLIITLATLLLGLNAQAEQPPYAVIKSVQIDGSGCDAGSAQAVMTDDLGFLSVLYNQFSAEIGKGTAHPGAKQNERKCTIQVIVDIPPGWNFEFDSVEYRGFVELPNKMTKAFQIIQAEVYGGRGFAFDSDLMSGPRNQNYSMIVSNRATNGGVSTGSNTLDKISDLAGIIKKIKHGGPQSAGRNGGCSSEPQNTKIKIKSVIGVRNLLAGLTKPAVRIVVDSTDASFRQNLKLNWYRCQ